jgi:hypothetical protein
MGWIYQRPSMKTLSQRTCLKPCACVLSHFYKKKKWKAKIMQGFLHTRPPQPASSRSRPQLTATPNIATTDWGKGKSSKAASSASSHTHKPAVFGPEHCCWRLHLLNAASFVSFKDYDEQPYIIKLCHIFGVTVPFAKLHIYGIGPFYHATSGTTI